MAVKLNSTGGGSVTLDTPSTASNYTVTLPTANTTLADTSSTQTLTNKTLTAAGSNTVEATSGPTSSQLAGQRNKIINGAMMIDQRNAGAAVTPAAAAYLVDRFNIFMSQASKFSVQQNQGSVTPPTGFSNYLGFTVVSSVAIGASDYFGFEQKTEGFNTADFAWGSASAQTVTLSFWVRSSLTGTFGGAVKTSNYAYAYAYTISAANTWEYKTIVIPGATSGTWATNNTTSLRVQFGLGVGSTYSKAAGSWSSTDAISATGATSVVGTNGATFYITGVQLEKGATATPFENRLYGTELALCERYFQVDSNNGGAYVHLYPGFYASTTGAAVVKTFTVDMRATPTATATAANTFLVDGASPLTPSAISFPGYGTNKTYRISATVVGGVAGQAVILAGAGSGTATITYSAEL